MKPTQRILYAGDTALSSAAAYLAGILSHYKLPFDYLASDQPIAAALQGGAYGLYILSDYPRSNFRRADFAAVLAAVQAGAGLLMIGGWDSFQGLAGHYAGSPLEQALPVRLRRRDDRVNSPQPCVIEKTADHAILDGLPWRQPATVGGYNHVARKPASQVLLTARHTDIRVRGGQIHFKPGRAAPLLIVGRYGQGRTAAFTSDVAPHWVGTLVDWGKKRIQAQAPGGSAVEIGCDYAEFFARLVRWTMRR